MEWKRVRNWLILLVLAVDLFLAGNLAKQWLQAEQTLRQSAADAVTVANNRGVAVSLENILALPETMYLYETRRSDEMEQGAALALLGEDVLQESRGGGVSVYQTTDGELAFRRGGALELHTPWLGEDFSSLNCTEKLALAGVDTETALLREYNGAVELTQQFEGLPIFNSRLMCTCEGDMLQVRGRWMLAEEPTAGSLGMSRAQLVLALCDLLEVWQVTAPETVQAGYYLQGEDAQSLTLEPVWAVETEQGQLIMSCITGEQVNF